MSMTQEQYERARQEIIDRYSGIIGANEIAGYYEEAEIARRWRDRELEAVERQHVSAEDNR